VYSYGRFPDEVALPLPRIKDFFPFFSPAKMAQLTGPRSRGTLVYDPPPLFGGCRTNERVLNGRPFILRISEANRFYHLPFSIIRFPSRIRLSTKVAQGSDKVMVRLRMFFCFIAQRT